MRTERREQSGADLRYLLLCAAFFIVGIRGVFAEETALTGSAFDYAVQRGDYLISIGARFGEDPALIARDNGLKPDQRLKPGIKVRVDNRHIVPSKLPDGLIVNLPQRFLFYFKEGKLVSAYPVCVGKPSWKTPTGDFTVIEKSSHKTWIVPKSIQEEMQKEGKPVLTEVPPGEDNPLGKFWIGLSIPALGIHGTVAPASIFHFQSHGCIRLHPDDIESLYPEVERGTKGEIIYQPVLLAESEGRVYLEAHRDAYRMGDSSLEKLEKMALDAGLKDRVDWNIAAMVLKRREGLARDVSLEAR